MNKKDDLTGAIQRLREQRSDLPAQLPLWFENQRGTPNSFLRSALFAAVQGKDRAWFKNEVLASQKGITVTFTGQQLNQEDLTVWESLIHLVRERPLGAVYPLSAHSILQCAGLHTGNSQHKQLHDCLRRLTAGFVEIRQEGRAQYMGHLINSVLKKEISSHYEIEVNKTLIALYSAKQWTPIDVNQRQLLRNKPLALALHAHYSTHEAPYTYKLETLSAYIGSKNKDIYSFKQQLKKALQQLVDISFLSDFTLDGEMVTVNKRTTARLDRHGIRPR